MARGWDLIQYPPVLQRGLQPSGQMSISSSKQRSAVHPGLSPYHISSFFMVLVPEHRRHLIYY